MGGEGRVGVPVERGKKYRVRFADAPLGGRIRSVLAAEWGEEADFACIKDVLYTAFALSPVMAYKQFAARRLHLGETLDV